MIELEYDNYQGFYSKAHCYSLLNNIDLTLQNLQQAINLSPERCLEWARTDDYFANIVLTRDFKLWSTLR